MDIFQFTPLREGRRPPKGEAPLKDDFNSRPCVRGDALHRSSMEAPLNFNSRPCVRGDMDTAVVFISAAQFQFTPLREGRRPPKGEAPLKDDFNSRPCVRGDSKSSKAERKAPIFQFTPLREGRRLAQIIHSGTAKFQFTPLREGRRYIDIRNH